MADNQGQKVHKAGFVNIVGKPNVGKSTLMNALVGERLSIITSKAQTTRHRIMGILNGDDYQIVYSDTPGILEPVYELHKRMMTFVNTSFEDADVILFVTDIYEKDDEQVLAMLERAEAPILVLLNKVDLTDQEKVIEKIDFWQSKIKAKEIIPISALNKFNTQRVFDCILESLPENPPYYPKDEMTDKPERFFVSEAVREQIFLLYNKEIPYSCEVVVNSFVEEENIIRIEAVILVERESQKGIVIGARGEKLQRVGTTARKTIETFFDKHVYIKLFVKVEPDWRQKKKALEQFGY